MHDGPTYKRLSGVLIFGLPVPGTAPPFFEIVRELHEWLSGNDVSYAIVGGVAVVRSGASRTTGDIDVLVRRDEWNRLLKAGHEERFATGPDWATHRESGTPVDVLFTGDDWDLPFLLADPERAREWDSVVGAWFMAPAALLELKAAVYLSKRAEYGEAPAAHDLADVTALLTANPHLRDDALIETMDPSVRAVIKTIRHEVARYRQKRPPRGRDR